MLPVLDDSGGTKLDLNDVHMAADKSRRETEIAEGVAVRYRSR